MEKVLEGWVDWGAVQGSDEKPMDIIKEIKNCVCFFFLINKIDIPLARLRQKEKDTNN